MQVILTMILSFFASFFIYQEMDSAKYEKIMNDQIVLYERQEMPIISTERILNQNYNLTKHKSRVLALIIDDAALLEDIPPEYLIAAIKVESDFNYKVISSENAVGYAQIIPKYWNGKKGYNVYDRYENIYLSAYILRTYYNELKDWDKTFKAYNVGIYNFKNNKLISAQNRYLKKINKELDDIKSFKEEVIYAKM